MSVPHAFLGLLRKAPRHGYELKREYDALFGRGRPVQFGQVYSTLQRLLRDGLVEIVSEEPGRGPDRKLYAITDEGVTDLHEWLAGAEPAEPHIQSVMFMKVALALLAGRPARRYLERQRAEHHRRMQELTRFKNDNEDDVVAVLVADYALYH
ncbi:MAG: PadR family transcriptional regulator, partial [Actinomycetota bacterium]